MLVASGFLVGALGIATGQLWLLYLGYGVIGGIGLGIGYISPVSTLIKWFPDRPGLATGLAIMGFGGGALVASPAQRQAARRSTTAATTRPTRRRSPSGSAVTLLFVTLGIVYFVCHDVRRLRTSGCPPTAGRPRASTRPTVDEQVAGHHGERVGARTPIRTPQFWLLWVVLFCNVTAGIGILEQAAPMIQDFFRERRRLRASTAAAAGGFVGLLSLANMAGRFVWSSTSDVIGRKPIYMVYLGVGMVALRRCWPLVGAQLDRRCSCCSPASSSRSTAAASRPSRPTCATCSAPSRSARSTAAC